MINSCNTVANLFLRNSKLKPSKHSIFLLFQKRNYVNVYMKWKKDSYLDSIQSIHKSHELKPIIALKNWIIQASPQDHSIPISNVSKKGLPLGIHYKVARFLRKYPSFFEEFKGPKYNLPWFRLTKKANEIDQEEREVYERCKVDLVDRLRKVILMSTDEKKVLPLRIIKGLQWDLGLPDDFLKNPQDVSNGILRCKDIGDGEMGLGVSDDRKNERILSAVQKNASRIGVEVDEIAFPLFPSKGLRLKRKISDWLVEFQKLPYISPYDSFSYINSNNDLFEKRIVGMLHELLSLFVNHAAERKNFIILRKYLGFPQKIHKAFERHPYMFYLSLRSNTCTAILKEAYFNKSTIDLHPLATVRKKYADLLQESTIILRKRRFHCKDGSDRDILNDADDPNNEGCRVIV